MSACVTLDEVLAAAHARCASLVPETSGYLALAVGDATSRLPLRLDDRAVLLTTEGTVTVRSRGEPVAPAEAARLLRDLLARLLAASAGSMPNLAATARPRPTAEQDPDMVARELEAALIPVNRNAARRALARLARETLRAREAGRLKRARAEVRAAPAANEQTAAPVRPAANEQTAAPVRPAANEQTAAPVRPACAAAAPRDEVGGAQRGEVAAAPLAPTVVELTLSPGPVAPAIVELTLSPGLVACETAGPTLPAPALGTGSDEIAARAAVVEPSSEVALAPAHATHPGEQAEAFPEPTPTVVQAVVEIETAAALVEIPVVPELVEPARAVARVAPIAPSAPSIVAADGRAIPALSPADGDGDGAACREALTSPEGIEALLIELSPAPTEIVSLPQEPTPSESILVELSPDPAGVVTLSQEPTPSESILVELSPDPAGVVTLSQEPTPTVATAVWEERVAADSAAVIRVTEAPVDAIDAAADVVEAATEPPADVADAATEPPADVADAATEAPADVVDAATEPPADVAADVIDAAANVIDAATEPPADILDAPVDILDEPADIIDAAADAPADIIDAAADILDAAADAPADILDAAADAPAGIPRIAPDAVETARPPAIHFLLDAEAGLQVTPAYGGWPLVHHRDAAAVSVGPRASVASLEETVASLEETPAARHTLPWPIPAQRGDDAQAATAPATPTAAPAPAPAEASPSPHAEATTAAHAGAEPAEEPCPAGLSPIDAIVWSASRRSRSAHPPADGAGTSRVDELVARFMAQSEHSAQRRAARSMKALAGLDLTLTPPPVAALSATAARALPDARSPLADTRRPIPSEVPAPDAGQVAVGESSRPPVPLVTPRRKGLSLWLALVALALLCAVLVGTLRPELFASFAEPLARGALRAVPRAEARTPPPHD
ncbi:hypothetical protein WME89_36995 [Sorangium sp. So ce321]|uniref:hypothetical protein n=1 Tax=Sorangium sp. So ce321 TaxID=3133300 RepID=UPI003F62A1AF